MNNMPESSKKTNASKLREEDVDSLIDYIMNEQELQPDLENMNLNNQELRPLDKRRPIFLMEGCEPVSSDSEEDNGDECNTYRWCLCKNGDKVLPSAECSYCHEHYHLECFSKAKCENFKCFVCANDNDIIEKFKKEIIVRKNKEKNQTLPSLSLDKDTRNSSLVSLDLGMSSIEEEKENERKKLEKVRAKIKKPNEIKFIENLRKFNRTKRRKSIKSNKKENKNSRFKKKATKKALKADHSPTTVSNDLIAQNKAKKRTVLKEIKQKSNANKAKTSSKCLKVSTKGNLNEQGSFKETVYEDSSISSEKIPSINPNLNQSPTTSSHAQNGSIDSKPFSLEETKKSEIESINALNENKDEGSTDNAEKEESNEGPAFNAEKRISPAPINQQFPSITNSDYEDEELDVLILNEDMDLESESSDLENDIVNAANHSDKENDINSTLIGEQNQFKCIAKQDALNSHIKTLYAHENLNDNIGSNKNSEQNSKEVSLNTDCKIPTTAIIAKNEYKSDTLSSLNLAEVKPKSMPLDASECLDTLSYKSNFADNIQDELYTEKLEEDTSLDENQANLNFSLVLNTNSEKDKNKISSRTDEFWTGQIETQEGMLSAKVVSLYNLDHFYHNKFYFLLKNCFSSNIKSIRSKQVQNTSLYPYLHKFVKTKTHYFSFLKLAPFESTEFKNTINIMGEVLNTSASEIHKTFIDKLAILNNNESYLEMEIPKPCSHLISSLIIFSLKAKNGEIDHFFDKIFGLEIHRDVDKLMCVIISESNENIFKSLITTNQAKTQTLSTKTSSESEKQDDATNNESFLSQEKDKIEQVLNEPISNKRKNDSVDTSLDYCKKARLESARSNSSTTDDSNDLSRNSSKILDRSTSRKSSRLNDEEKNAVKRSREKQLKITGLKLTDNRTEDRSVVEALFKEIGENANKIKSVWRINRKNATLIIIVELRDKEDRISILQNAKNLRFSEKFCKVYIKRDLTYDEILIETRNRLNSRNKTCHRNRKWRNY